MPHKSPRDDEHPDSGRNIPSIGSQEPPSEPRQPATASRAEAATRSPVAPDSSVPEGGEQEPVSSEELSMDRPPKKPRKGWKDRLRDFQQALRDFQQALRDFQQALVDFLNIIAMIQAIPNDPGEDSALNSSPQPSSRLATLTIPTIENVEQGRKLLADIQSQDVVGDEDTDRLEILDAPETIGDRPSLPALPERFLNPLPPPSSRPQPGESEDVPLKVRSPLIDDVPPLLGENLQDVYIPEGDKAIQEDTNSRESRGNDSSAGEPEVIASPLTDGESEFVVTLLPNPIELPTIPGTSNVPVTPDDPQPNQQPATLPPNLPPELPSDPPLVGPMPLVGPLLLPPVPSQQEDDEPAGGEVLPVPPAEMPIDPPGPEEEIDLGNSPDSTLLEPGESEIPLDDSEGGSNDKNYDNDKNTELPPPSIVIPPIRLGENTEDILPEIPVDADPIQSGNDSGAPTPNPVDSDPVQSGDDTNVPAEPPVDVGSPAEPPPVETIVDASQGSRTIVIKEGEIVRIKGFTGVGKSSSLTNLIVEQIDTLKFIGLHLTSKNVVLDQRESDVVITFKESSDTTVILENVQLEELDNLKLIPDGWTSPIGNFLFDGDKIIKDTIDIFDADSDSGQLWNPGITTLLNNQSNVLIGSVQSDVIYGLGEDDSLSGSQGDDTLIGGMGDDILDGGVGNDLLIGNSGSDGFVLTSLPGIDVIQDFQIGEDYFLLDSTLSWNDLSVEVVESDLGMATEISISTTENIIAIIPNVELILDLDSHYSLFG